MESRNVPLAFDGDAKMLGHYIARAIDFIAKDDDDLSVVTIAEQIAVKKKAVLQLFDSGDTASHFEGERQFAALLTKILGWAGAHEAKKGITDAKICRAEQ
eukprot:1636936-Rhodomonas_salina.1